MTNLKSLIELLNDDSMKMITPLMADRQYTYNMLWLRLLTLAAELDKNGEISAPMVRPLIRISSCRNCTFPMEHLKSWKASATLIIAVF